MNTLSEGKPDTAATHRRLKAIELEWRERKAARVLRALDDAAIQLNKRFAGYTAVTIEKGDRAIILIKVGEDRELRLHLKLGFDNRGLLHQSFHVRDHQIRRRPAYEELDKEYTFNTMSEAVAFLVRACD
jgi:hypothetical protein